MSLYILFPLLLLQSGYLSYTNPEKDYSIEINDRAHYVRKEMEGGGGYSDVFNVVSATNPNVVDYIISISKVTEKEPYTLKTLLSDYYKNNFANSCGCEVTGIKQASYKNNTGVMFTIKIKKSNGNMAGYSYSIAKGNSIYNISFLTAETLLPKHSADYTLTLNSLQIFK